MCAFARRAVANAVVIFRTDKMERMSAECACEYWFRAGAGHREGSVTSFALNHRIEHVRARVYLYCLRKEKEKKGEKQEMERRAGGYIT